MNSIRICGKCCQYYVSFCIGSLPTTLGLMSHLHELYLFNNSFTNALPTEIGQLTNGLVSLAFEFNSLTGTSFFIKSGLVKVVVNWSGVVDHPGTVPTQLGLLTTVSSLGLFGNQFTGSVPSELGQLSNISFLALFENQLTGTWDVNVQGVLVLDSVRCLCGQECCRRSCDSCGPVKALRSTITTCRGH
jgi:hypothetical protein